MSKDLLHSGSEADGPTSVSLGRRERQSASIRDHATGLRPMMPMATMATMATIASATTCEGQTAQ